MKPIQQLVGLRVDDPSGAGSVHCDHLEWITTVRPTPVSRAYDILITQTIGAAPRVRVLSPSLKQLAAGGRIPHLYDQNKEVLCLYFPAASEFDDTKPIGPQILPWAATWFYYFEEWLISGEWSGGGLHPHLTRRRSHGGRVSPRHDQGQS